MNALYSWPLTEDMSHYQNDNGTKYRLFDGVWELADDMENPYWILNRDKMKDTALHWWLKYALRYYIMVGRYWPFGL